MTGRYGASIYWLETSVHTPRPPLRDLLDVDVAIVGAGYTGLWTAYHLLEAHAGLRVALLEGEEIGFGASGRNGGFAMTLLDMSLTHLRRNQGDAAARAAHEAVAASVVEIGECIERHGIDCDWTYGGLMVVATNPGQLRRVEADLRTAEALGLDGFSSLSAAQAQAEVASPAYLGALLEEHCGTVHPARLARGLADVVEGMGAQIFERTAMRGIEAHRGRIRVTTDGGVVLADQVVLATNAWAAATPWFETKVVPLHTHIILTEPLTAAQWDAVGWQRRQGIEDKRNYVHYYRRTADGRISWGGSDGVIYARAERITPARDRNERVFARLQRTFFETFPMLHGISFTHAWGGPVGMTPTFLPIFGTLEDGRLHYGLGYNGHGVAPSHTGGKILRDKVLGKPSELTSLCFVDRPELRFPPEPLRWAGAELTRRALLRQDRQMDRGKVVGEMDPLLLRAVNKLG